MILPIKSQQRIVQLQFVCHCAQYNNTFQKNSTLNNIFCNTSTQNNKYCNTSY